MITKFKIFENLHKKELNIGDWVICKEDYDDEVIYFINNNIGQYVEYRNDMPNSYIIEYNNVPEEYEDFFKQASSHYVFARGMYEYEIIYSSKNKEDLEAILNANKYNL